MNGVAACADPVSGNIKLDGLSLLRFLKFLLGSDPLTLGIYYMLEMGDYIEYINKYDNVVNKAIEIFNNGNTFPSYNEVTVHE
jgi:hypothetical protein